MSDNDCMLFVAQNSEQVEGHFEELIPCFSERRTVRLSMELDIIKC